MYGKDRDMQKERFTFGAYSGLAAALAAPAFLRTGVESARLGRSWFRRLMEHIRREMVARQTATALNRLDDRLLADIGINRADIHRIAHSSAAARDEGLFRA